ncbi:MAG: glycosyltransferase [Planctomycetales bacterium]|nr:glycosyltransferase [Planctomycetales bacterium]
MRICFVSTAKQWGGGEQVLATLIEAVASTQHEVALVARQCSPMARWGRQRPWLLVREQPGRGRSPVSLWQLRRWLIYHRFDVLVLNDPHAITSGGLASYHTDLLKIGIRHTIFPIRSAAKHNRLLDQVVCVSQAASQQCESAGILPEKTSIIYGGVPQRTVDPNDNAKVRNLFQSAAQDDSDRHLLAIGSLLPVKGFDTIIRAIARGTTASRGWHLWLAGGGPQRTALESLATQLQVDDRVHFLGFRAEVAELLANADLFVSASHSEGLSLVLIEAMLAGCPIAATAVGGTCEVMRVDASGKSPCAVLFEPGNVEQLTAAIDKGLARSPAQQLRVATAKNWAEATFSAQQMASSHLALYQQLLDAKKPRSKSKDARPQAA